MNILIGSLGNIRRYREVNYLIKDQEKETAGKFLPKVLIEHFNIDFAGYFLTDTLVQNFKNNYHEMFNNIKDLHLKFFKDKNVENVKIHIMPGVGNYKEGQFVGNMADAYYVALAELYKMFISDEVIKSDEIKVVLDISLGINYQLNILYRALMDILPIIAYFKKVKFIVTNSEPALGINDKLDVFIHIIEEKEINQDINHLDNYKKKFLTILSTLIKSKKEEIGKNFIAPFEEEIRNIIKSRCINDIFVNVENLIKSVFYGLPLLFIVSYKNINYSRVIDKILEYYYKAIEINEKERKVIRNLEFGDGLKYLIFSELFVEYFRKLFGELNATKISYEKLLELSDFIWKINEGKERKNQISAFLRKDLYELKECFKFLKENVTEPYDYEKFKRMRLNEEKEVDKKVKDIKSKKSQSDENRNFLAHSSLSNNTFELLKENSTVYLKLNIEEIIKVSKNIN